MLKNTMITAVSLSALLFSGYINNTSSGTKPQPLTITGKSAANGNARNNLADTTRLKVGDKCPDLVFRDTSGHDVKLSDFKGKYVVIDVWASWCHPCRVQHPHLVSLEEKMKNKAITFVGISIDTQVWRWKGPVLAGMGGIQLLVKDEVFERAFGINTIPRFILLDKKGKILNLNLPMPSHPELELELNKLKGI